MNLNKKFTLVHQTPEHFILHDGQAHFHIAKKGLGKDLISKIQSFADGGDVQESEADKIGKSVSQGVDPDKAAQFHPFEEGGKVEQSEEDKMGNSVPSNVVPEKASQFHPFQEGGKVQQYNEPEPAPTPIPQVADPNKLQQLNKSFGEAKYKGGKVGAVEDEGPRKRRDGPIGTGGAEAAFSKGGKLPKLGSGKRFENLKNKLSHQEGVTDPGALAASIGRKKYGAKKMNALAQHKHMAHGGEVDHNNNPKEMESETKELNTNKEHELLRNWINEHVYPQQNFEEGGEVKDSITPTLPEKEDIDDMPKAIPYSQQPKEFFLANGGKIQYFAGTDNPSDSVVITPEEEAEAQHAGDMPPSPAPSQEEIAAAQQSAQGLSEVTGTPMPEASAAGQTVPPEQQVSFVPSSSAPSAPTPTTSDDKYAMPQSLGQAETMQAGAIGTSADAQAKAATQTAETMKGFYDQEKQRQDIVNTHLQQIDAQNDELFKNAVTNKINPNRLWQNISTPGKISVALGLILGGIGSGMTGQPNQAAKFIENAISQDIEAQKLDQTNSMNAYKMGLEKYKDTQSASAFATVQAHTLVAAKLQQIASNSQNPAIISAAQNQIAQLYKTDAPLKMDLAQRSLALSLTSGGSANINPEGLAPEYRERAVQLPNGQIALAPTKEDATTVKKALNSYGNIDNQLTQMYNTLKTGGRAINPLGSYAATSESMRDNVILELNHLHDLNRLNEREFDTYKKMVPGPGDLLQNRAIAKIMQLKNIIKGHTQSEYQEHLTNYKQPQIQTGPPTFDQSPLSNKQFNKIGR